MVTKVSISHCSSTHLESLASVIQTFSFTQELIAVRSFIVYHDPMYHKATPNCRFHHLKRFPLSSALVTLDINILPKRVDQMRLGLKAI